VKFVSLPDIPDVIERITISYVVKDTEHWSASVGRDMSCNRLGWHDANQISYSQMVTSGSVGRVRSYCGRLHWNSQWQSMPSKVMERSSDMSGPYKRVRRDVFGRVEDNVRGNREEEK
jgi:nicotinamide mononucleotide adenylyltransferase